MDDYLRKRAAAYGAEVVNGLMTKMDVPTDNDSPYVDASLFRKQDTHKQDTSSHVYVDTSALSLEAHFGARNPVHSSVVNDTYIDTAILRSGARSPVHSSLVTCFKFVV